MPKVTIELDDDTSTRLEAVKKRGENLQKACLRILQDIAEAPRPDEGVNEYRAMMVPEWFHRLGTCYDRELAAEVYGEKGKSNIPRISNIRAAIKLTSFRRQGKPRKFTPQERMNNWAFLKKGTFNSTAITTALGFRNADDAIAWAKENGVDDMVQRLTKRRKKKVG